MGFGALRRQGERGEQSGEEPELLDIRITYGRFTSPDDGRCRIARFYDPETYELRVAKAVGGWVKADQVRGAVCVFARVSVAGLLWRLPAVLLPTVLLQLQSSFSIHPSPPGCSDLLCSALSCMLHDTGQEPEELHSPIVMPEDRWKCPWERVTTSPNGGTREEADRRVYVWLYKYFRLTTISGQSAFPSAPQGTGLCDLRMGRRR